MDETFLRQLLTDTDKRFDPAASDETIPHDDTAFVAALRLQRTSQIRRRRWLGSVAVLVLLAGVAGWSWNLGLWRDLPIEAIAANEESHADRDAPVRTANEPSQSRLRDEQVARLKAEIAALDAEANQAQRFVELYQAAESRRDRLAAAEAASTEPPLPPQVVADLEIERAAAITIISADSQVNEFNRLAEAVASYHSVLRNFPDSRWAIKAQQRLIDVEHMN